MSCPDLKGRWLQEQQANTTTTTLFSISEICNLPFSFLRSSNHKRFFQFPIPSSYHLHLQHFTHVSYVSYSMLGFRLLLRQQSLIFYITCNWYLHYWFFNLDIDRTCNKRVMSCCLVDNNDRIAESMQSSTSRLSADDDNFHLSLCSLPKPKANCPHHHLHCNHHPLTMIKTFLFFLSIVMLIDSSAIVIGVNGTRSGKLVFFSYPTLCEVDEVEWRSIFSSNDGDSVRTNSLPYVCVDSRFSFPFWRILLSILENMFLLCLLNNCHHHFHCVFERMTSNHELRHSHLPCCLHLFSLESIVNFFCVDCMLYVDCMLCELLFTHNRNTFHISTTWFFAILAARLNISFHLESG